MIEICLATQKEDFIRIEKLGERIWLEYYTPIIGAQQVAYMLEKFQSVQAIDNQVLKGFEYYTINLDRNLIGYMSLVEKENGLFLSKFYISKDERGKGIGKYTLGFVIDKLRVLGLNKISLTVNKYNSNSIKTYEKMGFETTDSTITAIGNGYIMDDFVMTKTIN